MSQPRLSLIHATRGRTKEPLEAYRYRLERVSGKYEVEYIFVVDEDDPVGRDAVGDFLAKGNDGKLVVVPLVMWPRMCHIAALNTGFRASTGDIVVHGDDDQRCMPQWDAVVVEAFGDWTKPAVLGVGDPHFVDGHRPGAYSGDGMLTCFVMTRAYANKQGGVMIYPEYDGMQSDFDITQKAALEDLLIDRYDTITFSQWWHGGENDPLRDATHDRHQLRECHNIGYAVLGERLQQGFPDIRLTNNSNAVDLDHAAGRLAPPYDVVTKQKALENRRARGFGHIAQVPHEEGSARWLFLAGQYKEARAAIEPLMKKWHLRACGGRFRFHGGVQIWNECTKQIGDRNLMDILDPCPF